MVELVADVVRNPKFPESELARLKANMLRNLAVQLSQPQQLALEKFRAVLYGDHPYGRCLPDRGDAQGYTLEQVSGFYQQNYGAARSHVYVVGRFDERRSRRRSARPSRLGKGSAPVQPKPPKPTRAGGLPDRRPGAPQSTRHHRHARSSIPRAPDCVPLTVMDALLGGSFASRITTNIREQKGYTYSPYSQLSTRYRDAYWAENADVTTTVTGPSLKEIFAEIDRLQAEPPTAGGAEGHPELPGRHLRPPELQSRRHHRPAGVHGPARPAAELRQTLRQAGLRGHAGAGPGDGEEAPVGRPGAPS